MNNAKAWIVTACAASAALLTGVVLPVDAYLGTVAVLFALAAAAIVTIVQLDQPFWGVVLLVVTGVALPIEFPGPSAVMLSSCFPLAAMLCGIWLLRVTVARRPSALDAPRVIYSAVAFMAITLLSFAYGQFPWFPSGGAPLPAQVAELALFLLSVCLLLAVGYQINSLVQLKWLVAIFILAGTFTCILQMLPQLRFIARMTSRPGSVGSLFWTWLVALSFAQALFNRRLSWPTRLFLLGVNALVLYHGLVQVRSWASGWVPVLAALGIIVLVKIPRLSVGLGIAALSIGLFLRDYITTVLLAEESYSLSTRTEGWSVLWNLVERSPLLGTGPANYYYYTENFPILGWYVRFIAHNNYQDLLVQTGFLGLIAFCWFAFEVLWMMGRMYRQTPPGFARAYVVGACGGLVGSLVSGMLGDWIIPFYYNAGILGFRSSLLFWVFLGGALALKRITANAVGAPVADALTDRQEDWSLHPRKLVGAH